MAVVCTLLLEQIKLAMCSSLRYSLLTGLSLLTLSGCGVPSFEEKCEKNLLPAQFQFIKPPTAQIEITNLTKAEMQDKLANFESENLLYLTFTAAGTYTVQLNSLHKKFNVTQCARPDVTVRLPLQLKIYIAKEVAENPCKTSILKEYVQTKLSNIDNLAEVLHQELTTNLSEYYATYYELADSPEELQAKVTTVMQTKVTKPLLDFNRAAEQIIKNQDDLPEILKLVAQCPA